MAEIEKRDATDLFALGQIVRLQIRQALTEAGYPEDCPFVFGGGFFRDQLLGAPIKDIDVFVSGTIMKEKAERSDDEYGELYGPVKTLERKVVGYYPIEVIFLHPDIPIVCEDVAERFDIGICRIVMDHHGRLLVTEEAQKDYMNRTLTVFRLNATNNSRERVQKRLDKIMAKTPAEEQWSVDWNFFGDEQLQLTEET